MAGDICAITKLGSAETGDTVSAEGAPLLVEAWDMPEPLMPVAVEAATRSDEDALAKSLGKVAAGDPTLRVERNSETHQLILWCMGEAHGEVVLDRLRDQGVKLQTVQVVTPLRETFAAPAAGHGRYVKQSGGHGQYAICDIEVEPLERGAGFEFVDKTVGGVVPGQYIGSVEKGVRAQMQKGVSAGFPVVDIRVTLVGGKAHSVDSSDAAFQAAGALALREAAAAGRIQLLEPVSAVTISIPDEYVGRRHERPVLPPRPADGNDVGRRGRHGGHRRGPGRGTPALRRPAAGADRRHRPVPPQLPAARTRSRATWRRRPRTPDRSAAPFAQH